MAADFSVEACSAYFSPDFFSAQDVFLAEAGRVSKEGSCELISVANVAVNTEYVDALSVSPAALWLGHKDADKVLVLISGTHGVEGFCGSAIQSFLLAHWRAEKLPPNTAVLIVHALNAWGMQWARRCDAQGIDLNRNFIDFNRLPVPHPYYDRVRACYTLNKLDQQRGALMGLAAELSQWDYDQAVSSGQYIDNWAPFYGGQGPSVASQWLQALVGKLELSERQLIVLDLHSGLGPWGYGELISDHPAASGANNFARKLFHQALAVTDEGSSYSVPKLGLLDYYWHDIINDNGCFLTLEFGSYGTQALFDVIMQDHLLWRGIDNIASLPAAYVKHRSAIIEHFCPADSLWRQSVLFRGWQVCERVLQYFGQ